MIFKAIVNDTLISWWDIITHDLVLGKNTPSEVLPVVLLHLLLSCFGENQMNQVAALQLEMKNSLPLC